MTTESGPSQAEARSQARQPSDDGSGFLPESLLRLLLSECLRAWASSPERSAESLLVKDGHPGDPRCLLGQGECPFPHCELTEDWVFNPLKPCKTDAALGISLPSRQAAKAWFLHGFGTQRDKADPGRGDQPAWSCEGAWGSQDFRA